MTRKTNELEYLELPVEEGARVVALARVKEVEAAADRLQRGDDVEALHDFRVGLRRLRTVLRAFRPWLSKGPKRKHERKLKRLTASTNPARDNEVQLTWLSEQADKLKGDRRRGLEWLVARYETRRQESAGLGVAVAEWRDLSRVLRRKLEVYERRVRPLSVDPISEVLARVLREELKAFRAALAAIEDSDDVEHVHRARIKGKRLRYLLEPLVVHEGLGAKEAVRTLKDLQDVLGELHDTHVLLADIDVAREESTDGPRPPALWPVARLARARRDHLYGRLAQARTDGSAILLSRKVALLAAVLETLSPVRTEVNASPSFPPEPSKKAQPEGPPVHPTD